MARSIAASPSRSVAKRPLAKRLGAGLAGVALAAVMAGCATPYVSDSGSSSPSGSSTSVVNEQSEIVIVCESGIVTGPDGVETSSQVVSRIPVGDPIPDGCVVA